VKQFKLAINDELISQVSQNNYFQNFLTLKKYIHEPIISIEHFVDIDSLIGNNYQTGVGVNSEKKTCRQKNNSVKSINSPGGTWLSSF
jgi:hypothetical protein